MSSYRDPTRKPTLKLPTNDNAMDISGGGGSNTVSATSPVNSKGEEIKAHIADLSSQEPLILIKGLNFLSQKSYNTSDEFSLEHYPSIILALCNLLNNLNPIGNLVFSYENPSPILIQTGCINELILDGWDAVPRSLTSLSTYNNFKTQACAVEDNQFVLTILNILKNFSLETCNEMLLAYAEPIVRHCVSLLWLMDVQNNFLNNSLIQTDAMQYCLEIITNIAIRIDISGKKRTQNNVWLEDTLAKGYPKSALHFRLSPHMAEDSAMSYTAVTSSLLPLIHMHIKASSSRAMVLKCLEILVKLAQNDNQYLSPVSPDNTAIFLKCPDAFYESLVELLCVSITSIEPLAQGTTDKYKPPAFVGASFFGDLNDVEIRDAALDAIYAMCTPERGMYTSKIQLRFAAIPKCLQILLRISEGKNARALALLYLFGNRIENQQKFLSIHLDMIQSAYNDDGIADFATTSTLIYAGNVNPPYQDEKQ